MDFTSITSFDRTETCQAHLLRPEKYAELLSLSHTKMITRGAGLSYCNAGVVENGVTIDISAFNRILSLDPEKQTITAEAGMTIGDLSNFLISKGWIMPVVPGYPSITIGGCLAFNVHGKSQFNTGNIIDWVEAFTLFHPACGLIYCSREENKQLFELTIGGIGLTGIIVSASLKLKKLPGNMLQTKVVKAANLDEAVRIMYENKEAYDYMHTYNDFNLENQYFGKGLVYLQKYSGDFKAAKPQVYLNRMGRGTKSYNLYSPAMLKLSNRAYYLAGLIKPSGKNVNIAQAFFPIYSNERYYQFLGKKGFREYQVIFGPDQWPAAAEEIKKLIKDSNMAIALGSLKLFKGKPHYISFSGQGVCIIIDVPDNEKALLFFQALDKITIQHKGTINLSKDSRASAPLVQAVFPAYNDFRQKIHAFDTSRTFVSELSKRIDI